jgi:glycosyltransferase involved in cell wall biosynthesis
MRTDKTLDVIVNGRSLGRRLTGVERFTVQLLRHLKGRVRIVQPPMWLAGPVGHAWEQLYLPLMVGRAAILLSPANTGPVSISRQVVTIHDLSPLDHPQWFRPAFARLYQALLPRLVARSLAVIVPSRFTRQRLLAYPWARPQTIFVVPAGVDHAFFYPRSPAEVHAIRLRHELSGEYFLAVGSLQPRKNLTALLAAWKLLAAGWPQLSLVLVGASAPHFGRQVFEPAPAGVRFLGYIPDRDLPALYSGALALVSPSLEEGFGLPLLEAMACATPVAASNAGALPELVGGCGLLFDPHQPQAIAACLEGLAEDPRLRRHLAASGLERSHCYDWGRTARLIWDRTQALA